MVYRGDALHGLRILPVKSHLMLHSDPRLGISIFKPEPEALSLRLVLPRLKRES